MIPTGIVNGIDILPLQAGICQRLGHARGLNLEGTHSRGDSQGVLVNTDNGGFSPLRHTRSFLCKQNVVDKTAATVAYGSIAVNASEACFSVDLEA